MSLETYTLETAEAVVDFLLSLNDVIAVGIDSLTCWSTGPSGWRPADRWLRQKYPDVINSVVAPNSLRGAMGINGPTVMIAYQAINPSVLITETHPKVIYWHLAERRYDYVNDSAHMDAFLASLLNVNIEVGSEHAWDAAISAVAALRGLSGRWKKDLHQLSTNASERIIWPCKPTHYFWP